MVIFDMIKLVKILDGYISPEGRAAIIIKEKLCNCGVIYIRNYYISYIIFQTNSNGYMPHCGKIWMDESTGKGGGVIDYSWPLSAFKANH